MDWVAGGDVADCSSPFKLEIMVLATRNNLLHLLNSPQIANIPQRSQTNQPPPSIINLAQQLLLSRIDPRQYNTQFPIIFIGAHILQDCDTILGGDDFFLD